MLVKQYKVLRAYFGVFSKAVQIVLLADKKLFILLSATILVAGLLPGLAIRASAQLIDYITTAHSIDMRTVIRFLATWGGCLIGYNLMGPWTLFLQGNLADKTVFTINSSIMQKSNAIEGLTYFEQEQFHNDLQVILNQSYHKPINLVVTLVGLAKDLILITSCIGLLWAKISWISAITLINIIVHVKLANRVQTQMWQESLGRSPTSRAMNYLSALSINPSYAKEIRLFPLMGYLHKTYSKLFCQIYNAALRLRRRQLLWPLIPNTLNLLIQCFILYHIINLIKGGKLFVGTIALLLQAFTQLYQSVSSFGEQAGWLTGHLLFFEKYFDFLKTPEKIYSFIKAPLQVIDPAVPGTLTFDHVSFLYPDGRMALQDISFEVQPREKLAIVGANGAGKTSLIKLLCGFYAPSNGRICIQSVPVENVDLKVLRQWIAPIFQDFGSYALSLRENIVMGDLEVDEDRLQYAIHAAGIDFINALPKGLEQPLGKIFGGTDLSAGQWQQIAIARGLYKKAQVFIFDEPTAALDPLRESNLFDRLAIALESKTVIFVTHRLTSVKMAHRVLLLDHGVQLGIAPHAELLKSNLLYQSMFEAQASKYIDLDVR